MHIHKFNRLNCSAKSVFFNLEKVTEVPYPSRAVNSVHKEKLKESIRVYGFQMSYSLLTVTLFGDKDASKDPLVFLREVKLPTDGVNLSLVDRVIALQLFYNSEPSEHRTISKRRACRCP